MNNGLMTRDYEMVATSEVDIPENLDDHAAVGSDTFTPGELAAETSSFGKLGAPSESASAHEGLEFVPGYEPLSTEVDYMTAEGMEQESDLLDAYYAEFGDPAVARSLKHHPELAEVVIGTDDRVQITATTSYPWRAICSLLITAANNTRWIGTGWLVGPRTVITAGHCVFMHSQGGWAKSIEVIPGRNGSSRPYGSCSSSALRSVKGWTQDGKRNYDYGAIILPTNCRYGDQVGYFGYGYYTNSTLNNLTVNLSGYPGDKPTGTQWFMSRRIKSVQSRVLVYDIDTAGGQSGAPVWWLKNGSRYAVGIHTNGSLSGNSATRITEPVFNNIKAWKAQGS